MRKCLVALTLLFSCINTSFALQGLGTEASPWLIQSLTDFDEFAADPNYWDDYTRLDCDIDLDPNTSRQPYSKAPIASGKGSDSGFQGIPFTGTFNGNNHVISNLTINGVEYLGLFGCIRSGSVTNLVLENVDISAILYCVGGLCGLNDGGNITNCYATGSVTGCGYLGGLCGYNDSGTITNCYAADSVIGDDYLGGLCGYNYYGTISNCYATGSVTGDYGLGGLCGYNYYGTISNCYATGSVTGYCCLGGLCGHNDSGTITNCYATGSVTGEVGLGGLCGYNDSGTISNCYATGSMTGYGSLGGLCGGNDSGTITNCYATGSMTGYGSLGGLCGYNDSGTISNCYFYLLAGPDNNLGTPLNESQFDDAESFAGFDFAGNPNDGTNDDWDIIPGHCPKLTWQTDDGPLPPNVSTSLSGSGYSDDPFQINSPADFNEFISNASLSYGFFVLNTDIDLSAETFDTAVINRNFGGYFDGAGHVIRNITIDTATAYTYYLGLFRIICASVSNLGIENISITGGADFHCLGSLCGRNSSGTISNCYATGSVTGDSSLGGLCGYNYYGTISNCYATGSVTGNYDLGGLCGYNYYGTISNCYATGSVTGNYGLGGLCGYNYYGTISNCYSTSLVTGNYGLGGLCGYNYYGTISNCYATGSVTGDNSLGGLCGDNGGTITNCYSTGSVIGTGDYAGGLCGDNEGTITNCYSTGAVTGYSRVGGLVGREYGSFAKIENCYSTGLVSATGSYKGGLLGYLWYPSSGTVTGCFWDTQTSGTTDGVGNVNPDPTGVSGKTTIQMQDINTFLAANWDFENLWHMPYESTGYPMLFWQRDIPGDFTAGYGVTLADFAVFSQAWLTASGQPGYNDDCDLVDDNTINLADLTLFAENFLQGI